MGWKLAEEVACARPIRPGPEWWTLLDLAQAASDETRRAWPGHEYLMTRARASRATVYRRIKILVGEGLLVVAVKSAPGQRAVYEFPVIHSLATGLSVSETCSDGQRVSVSGQRVSKTGPTGLSVSDAPLVSSSVTLSRQINRPAVNSKVEVNGTTLDQERYQRDEAERKRQLAALEQMMTEVPEPAAEPCRRCGDRPGGNGGRSFCGPCIAEVKEEDRQMAEAMAKVKARQEADLEHVQEWQWERLVLPPHRKRRQRETVKVSKHPSGWIPTLGFDHRTQTCQSVFEYARSSDIDGYHAFHAEHPVIWKCEVWQGRTRITQYCCDAHLPDEFRPAETLTEEKKDHDPAAAR